MANRDVITAVLVRGRRLEWTTLRRRKGVYEVADQQGVELDIPEKREDRDTAEWAARIKQAMGGIKGHLTVTLHTEHALLRAVDLPSSDADELAGMVELQVDKFSPFPVEQMAISHEVLGGKGSNSRVLIAACKREVVDDLGALFTAAGRQPDRIDIAATGWWHLMQQAGRVPAEGRHAVLLVDETGTELVVNQDGLPVVVRSLGAQHRLSDEEYAGELAEETGYTLTSLESEWGATAVPDLTVWHRGETPTELVSRLGAECAVETHAQSLDDLPPLTEGVARRDAESGRTVLDLIPPEWKAEATERKGQRRIITLVASLLVLWIVVLVAFFVVAHFDEARIERLRGEVAALEGPAEEARLLRHRVESLEQFADRTHSALECLREVTELLPGEVELNSFTYRKAGAVNLRGESPRETSILDYFEALEQSELFVEVRPEGLTRAPGGRRNPEFRVTARLPGEDNR